MTRVWVVSLCCGILWISYAWAVVPVVDEASLIQTTVTAAKAVLTEAHNLESNTHEAMQIKNQVDAYVQQAKHLVAVPMSYVNDIAAMYQQYNAMLQQARGISYTLQDSVQQFEALYTIAAHGNMGAAQRAQAMLQQVRHASLTATQVTAIWEALCLTQGKVETLVAVSQAAPGTTAAIQAANQLAAVNIGMQGDIARMQATVGRAQISYIMQETVANEQAQQNASQWLQGYGTEVFRGPGQGRGPKLPD